MTCPEVHDQLSAYVDGQLPDDTLSVVRRHLNDCAACQREEATLRSVSQLLRGWEETAPPPLIVAETRAQVYQRMSQPRRHWIPLRVWIAAGAAACVLLTAGLGIQRNASDGREHGGRVSQYIPPKPTPAATRRLPAITIHPTVHPNLQSVIRNSQFAIKPRQPRPILQEPEPMPPSVRAEESIYAKSLLVACADPDRLPMYAAILSAREGELQRKVTGADEGEDARLNAKVTLNVRGRPLGEVLEGLSKQTSVHLEADDSVREQKVVLLLKDLPLREVMTQLQKLFDFDWVREKDANGQWQYVLTKSVRSQALADAARHSVIARAYQLAEERLKEIVRAIETNDLERAERIGLPDFTEALRKKMNGVYAKTGQNLPKSQEEAFRSLQRQGKESDSKAAWLLLTKDAAFAILNGRGWQARFTDLTPEQRVYFFLAFWGAGSIWEGSETHDVRIVLEGVEQGQPSLRFSTAGQGGGGRTSASHAHRLVVSQPTATRADLSKLIERLRKEDARYNEPALQVAVTLPSRPLSLIDIEDSMREQMGLSVVSDFYHAHRALETTYKTGISFPWNVARANYRQSSYPPVRGFAPPSLLTLAELLAFLEQAKVDWTFDKSGNLLRLKNHLWMFDDQFEPPQKAVDEFKAVIEKKRGWDLEDLSSLTNLTEEQLYGLSKAVGHESMGTTVNSIYGLLRLYGQLSSDLRRRCWGEEGLGPNHVIEPQVRDEFYRLILKIKPGLPLDEMEGVRFRIVRKVSTSKSDDQAFVNELRQKGTVRFYSVSGLGYSDFLKDGAKEVEWLCLLLEFRKVEPREFYAWFTCLPPKGLYPKEKSMGQ